MLREPSPLQMSPQAWARQNAIKNNNLSILRVIGPLLRPYLKLVLGGLLGVLGASLAVLGLGQVFRSVIDSGIRVGDDAALRHGILALIGLVLVLAASSYARLVFLTGLAEQVIADLRAQILRHVLRLHSAWFETQKTGDLLSRLTADCSVLQILIGTSLPTALRNIFMTIGGIVLMVLSSPTLCLIMLAVVPFVLGVLFLVGPRVRESGKALQDSVGAVGAQLVESLTAVREIQAFSREEQQASRFAEVNNEAVAAAWRYVRRRGVLSASIITLLFSSIASLLWFGGQHVIHGTLSPGQLSAFVFYGLLVAGSAGALSETYGDIQRAAGSLARLQALRDVEPRIQAPVKPKMLPQEPHQIQLQQVRFHHESRPDVQTLNDISLTLDMNQTIAFVGPSGAGKSTLFDMLLRFYDPTGGQVLLDGTDIRQLDPQEYRRLFAWVPQDPTLFSMSIADNIGFGSADFKRIVQAAEHAGIAEFIQALPEGYATMLGERGVNLSGGQAQRIALARALAQQPKVLLLDEATAHLDTRTEEIVYAHLREAQRGRGICLIAHRLSTVQQADRIIVLEAGGIVADGTHQELINHSPLYQKLARSFVQERD